MEWTSPNVSYFKSVAAGNSCIYAAGVIKGTEQFNFDILLSLTGPYTGYNSSLVKYDTNGNPQWARTVVSGSNNSYFNSVAVDSGGNVYAAGEIDGAQEYDFGNSQTVTGAYDSGGNIVLVKYDTDGVPQWARSVTAALGSSNFNSVTMGSDGNIYAVGSICGSGTYDFGNSQQVTSSYDGCSVVVVKYNTSGTTLSATSVTGGANQSWFYSVAAGSDGIYAAGSISGTGSHNFGNSQYASGTFTGNNIVLVKYNTSLVAQWATSVTTGPNSSLFNSVVVGDAGNIYAAGYITGKLPFDFSISASAQAYNNSGINIVLVQYDTNGDAQWARTVNGWNDSYYTSITAGTDGIYAAGIIYGTYAFDFGNSIIVSGSYIQHNVVLAKYNTAGDTQWAKSLTTGPNFSTFNAVTFGSDNIYSAGEIYGTSEYNFGDNKTVSGAYNTSNVLLVKYDSISITQWAKSLVE